MDISSCSTATEQDLTFRYSGHFINLSARIPAENIQMQTNNSKGMVYHGKINKEGAIKTSLYQSENHDYPLYVHDNRFKHANPNHNVPLIEKQVWQVLQSSD